MKKLLLVLLFFSVYFMYSQTPYLNKVNRIKTEYFTTMGADPTTKDEWIDSYFDSFRDFQKFLWDHPSVLTQRFMANLKTDKGAALTNAFLAELQKAKPLASPADGKFYDDRIQEERDKKTIASSAMSIVPKMISDSISKFKQKGEFEKTSDYEARMQPNAVQLKLVALIDKLVKENSNLKSDRYFTQTEQFYFSADNYDADQEKLLLHIGHASYFVRLHPKSAEFVKNNQSSFSLKPAPDTSIVVNDKGEYCYEKFYLIQNEENHNVGIVELINPSKPIIFNLKDFDNRLSNTYNFTDSYRTEKLTLNKFVGVWYANNTFIYLKLDGKINIQRIVYDENSDPNVKANEIFAGEWNFKENKIMAVSYSDTGTDVKELNLPVVSIADNVMVIRTKSGDVQYEKLNQEQLNAKQTKYQNSCGASRH